MNIYHLLKFRKGRAFVHFFATASLVGIIGGLLLLIFWGGMAHAYSDYTRTPLGTGYLGEDITFTVTKDEGTCESPRPYWSVLMETNGGFKPAGDLSTEYGVSVDEDTGIFNAVPNLSDLEWNLEVYSVGIYNTRFDGSDPVLCEMIEYDGGDVIFRLGFEPVVPPNNGGLLGDGASAAIISGVTGGVQETGDNTWPLLAFIGVPAAFAIARGVMLVIRTGI